MEKYQKVTHPSHLLPLWKKAYIVPAATVGIPRHYNATRDQHFTQEKPYYTITSSWK